jgi:hypothetical protein
MIPVCITVKLLQHFTLLEPIASLLEPVMQAVGVPADFGLVWVMALFVNIYAALAAFSVIVSEAGVNITVAQASVLGAMILYAHGLLVEGAIVREAGLGYRSSISLRIGAALLYGYFLNTFYSSLGLFQYNASPILLPSDNASISTAAWALNEGETLLWLLAILFALHLFIWLLRKLCLMSHLERASLPLLRIAGIDRSASLLVVVGLTLGIAFGGGLLFAEVRAGRVSREVARRAMLFLCLCHSVIEDTTLLLLLGGEIWGLLVIRTGFSLLLLLLLYQVSGLRTNKKTANALQ